MMIKKANENTFIEYRDRLTAGEKQRYQFAKIPKYKSGANGEIVLDLDNSYENSPNFYLLTRVIEKVFQDGKDITPKDKTVSSFLKMMDNELYENDLLEDVLKDILEKNGFFEKKTEKNIEK